MFRAPPSRPNWLVWVFLVLLAIGAVQLLASWLTSGLPDQIVLGTLLTLLAFGGILWRFLLAGRAEWAGWKTPDTLTFDSHGLGIRHRSTTLRLPWSAVRRIDGRGTGAESDRLRVWTVDGDVPKRLRGKDGAAVLMAFGDDFPREAIAEAAARFAPPGVRVRILSA